MKIARIVLTITILFSLKSNLFCSEQDQPFASIASASCQIPKKIGYDGSKLGWLPNSDIWTLEHHKEDYNHYGIIHEVRVDSDDEGEKGKASKQRWTTFGTSKKINTAALAHKFIKQTAKLHLDDDNETYLQSIELISLDYDKRKRRTFEILSAAARLHEQGEAVWKNESLNAAYPDIKINYDSSFDDKHATLLAEKINDMPQPVDPFTDFNETYKLYTAAMLAQLKENSKIMHQYVKDHSKLFKKYNIEKEPHEPHERIKSLKADQITEFGFQHFQKKSN